MTFKERTTIHTIVDEESAKVIRAESQKDRYPTCDQCGAWEYYRGIPDNWYQVYIMKDFHMNDKEEKHFCGVACLSAFYTANPQTVIDRAA